MRSFFGEYLKYYKDYKGKVFVAVIGMLLVAGASGLIAWLIKPVLDKIFIAHDQEMLLILPFFVVAAYLAKGVGAYLQTYFMNYIGQDIVRQIRDRFLAKVLRQDIDFFFRFHSGELISRIVNDVTRIQTAISTNFANFIREILTAIGLLGVVIYQSPKLAFFALIVLPSIVFPVSYLSKKMKKVAKKSQQKNSDITANLTETFSNIELIKAYDSLAFEESKFQEHNRNFFKLNMKSVRINASLIPIMEVVSAVAAAVVIYVGGVEVIEGKMSVGAFFSFMTALFMLSDPMRRISLYYNSFQDAIAAHERIKEIEAFVPTVVGGEASIPEVSYVKLENVFLNYDQKEALKGISLEAKKGEIIGLVGDSGGGKSSMINLLLRFYDVTKGMILLNDTSISDLSLESLREKIAIVTQRVYIFNDTVAANIAYGREVDYEKAEEMLKKAHLSEVVESLENGVETVLNESGTNLSGGQRQRIAIARALYRNPQILILDEATSALDNRSEAEIMETIQELSSELIIFVIAHRLNTVENATKVAVFKEGKIVCTDTVANLKKSCNEFQKLYKSSYNNTI